MRRTSRQPPGEPPSSVRRARRTRKTRTLYHSFPLCRCLCACVIVFLSSPYPNPPKIGFAPENAVLCKTQLNPPCHHA